MWHVGMIVLCEIGNSLLYIFGNGLMSMGHVGMGVICDRRNNLRKPATVALSSPQVLKLLSHLALNLRGLFVKTFS